ncbi:hypothetical protein [Bacillus sp. FJAT-22090]|uniref:hypothetical protein n=1 Tax=Bacillus sp. FJAT-22090 TaxID=1581038 RepID=UPI0011A34BA3|nr:hypothetical protein [Bacillus sp. FJAT-22090]
MKILRFVLIFLLGVVLTAVMTAFEINFWITYLSIIVLYALLLVAPTMYIVYKSNNLKRIERYLVTNKRKPLFAYALAIKSGNRESIIEAIQVILNKYKQPFIQQVYKTNLALFENNVSSVDLLAKQISKEPLRTYYMAYAEALKGNFEEAHVLKENLSSAWMQHAIEAIIAKEKGNMEAFSKEAATSIECARGIQKFSLVYSFKNMK